MHIPIKFKNESRFLKTPRLVLAADIGATKAYIALIQFEGKKISILKEKRYLAKDFSGAAQMISSFLMNSNVPDIISFGVAGPVQNGKVRITNLSWEIDTVTLE